MSWLTNIYEIASIFRDIQRSRPCYTRIQADRGRLRFARMDKLSPFFLLILTFQFVPRLTFACPLCHSGIAEEVRAGLITTSLDGITIPALVLPLALVALVVCAIQLDWDEFFDSRNEPEPKS